MSHFNYITSSTLFNTGFLPDTSVSRIKQGLLPQNVANLCQPMEPSSQLKNSSFMTKMGGDCNNNNLYPFPATQYSYGPGSIPDDCACARFLKAP